MSTHNIRVHGEKRKISILESILSRAVIMIREMVTLLIMRIKCFSIKPVFVGGIALAII